MSIEETDTSTVSNPSSLYQKPNHSNIILKYPAGQNQEKIKPVGRGNGAGRGAGNRNGVGECPAAAGTLVVRKSPPSEKSDVGRVDHELVPVAGRGSRAEGIVKPREIAQRRVA